MRPGVKEDLQRNIESELKQATIEELKNSEEIKKEFWKGWFRNF